MKRETHEYLRANRSPDHVPGEFVDSLPDVDGTLEDIGISGQGWALTRQGRLDEAERLSVVTADELEPRSLSTFSLSPILYNQYK